MSRSELTLLLFVLVVVVFLFWTRNVIVRVPGIPTPISSGALADPGGPGPPGAPCESPNSLTQMDRAQPPAQKLPTTNVARVASNPAAQRRTGSVS